MKERKSVLISIKPKFVKEIKSGRKIYEYRKVVPKNCNHLVIYSSYPVKKIVGECDYVVREAPKEELWEETKNRSGISKEYYDLYFRDKEIARCLLMNNIVFYDEPKTLEDFNIKVAPQNYLYL